MVGNILVGLGAVAGVVAAVLVAANYAPPLSPEMIKLLFFKGLGAAAVGLIIVGSLIGRFGKERERRLELEARLKQTMPQGSLNASPLSQMPEPDSRSYQAADPQMDSTENK